MMFYFFLVFILFLSVFLWGLYDIIIRSFDLDRSRQKKQPRNVVGCQRILNSTVVIENCTFAPTLTHMQKQRERERGIYRGQKERATHHTSTKSIDF